jgi:hypothetical protein
MKNGTKPDGMGLGSRSIIHAPVCPSIWVFTLNLEILLFTKRMLILM